MAFCDQCGREIKATARFCGSCGAPALAHSADTSAAGAPAVTAPAVTTQTVARAVGTNSASSANPEAVFEGSDARDIAARLGTLSPLTLAASVASSMDATVQSAVLGEVRKVLTGAGQVSRIVVEPAGTATPGSPAVIASIRLSDKRLIEQRFVSSHSAGTVEIARDGGPVLVDGARRHPLRVEPRKGRPEAHNASNNLDRIADRVSGRALPPASASSWSRTSAAGAIRPAANRSQMVDRLRWVYLAGIVLIGIGVRTAFFVTRYTTDLYTGDTHTSYPDMGIGIVLVTIGAALMGGTWLASNGQVHK